MKSTSLMICSSLAAFTLATGSALAQSEGVSPGAGESAPPSMEMAPPPGSDAPAPRMAPGSEGSSAGEAGRGPIGDRNLRAGEPFDGGDRSGSRRETRDPAEGRPGARDTGDRDMDDREGATGASEGEAGRDAERRDRPDRGERSERRAKGSDADKAERRSRAGDREAGRDRANRGERTRESRERDDDADRASEGASEGAEGKGRPSGSLTRLDSEKRSEVQSVFRTHRSEAIVEDIDIDVNIGVSVPRTVVLHEVPQEVIVLVPDYRAYKYFIYDDQVVVVDPDTLEIVDILVLA